MSCQAGSRWRSYQATYSSTIARVAGCVVTSSTRPSPMTQTRLPSRSASRYSAPVRIVLSSALRARVPEPRKLRRHNLAVCHIAVEHPCLAGEGVDRADRCLADGGVVERQVAAHDAGDQPGLAR